MRNISTTIGTIATLAILALGAQGALAQTGDTPATAHGMKQGGGKMELSGPDQRLKQLARRLALSEDQQAKIKPILEDEGSQLKALNDAKFTVDERRTKMQELRTATFEKIKPILTPEQLKKHDELLKEGKERLERLRHLKREPEPPPP